MRIIKPCTTEIQGWPDTDPIPDGWAELPPEVQIVTDPETGELLMSPICESPYLLPKTDREVLTKSLEDGWYSQIRKYSQVELAEDESRAEETRQDLAKYVTAVGVLANTADAELDTLSTTLADYEMSTADYARSPVRQETALLTAHDAEVAAGGAGLLSTDERT
ncbi:MAG: hypothetical protein WBN07_07010, partial [Woeseiaceae bacterium]